MPVNGTTHCLSIFFRASSLCMTGRPAPGAVGGHDQGGETLKSGPGQGLWCAKACLASGPFCHPKFVPLLFHFFSQNSAKDSKRKQNLRLSRDCAVKKKGLISLLFRDISPSFRWYPERGSNSHSQRPRDFKSLASTSSAIRAGCCVFIPARPVFVKRQIWQTL